MVGTNSRVETCTVDNSKVASGIWYVACDPTMVNQRYVTSMAMGDSGAESCTKFNFEGRLRNRPLFINKFDLGFLTLF